MVMTKPKQLNGSGIISEYLAKSLKFMNHYLQTPQFSLFYD